MGQEMHASVVIPTKNGMPAFGRVLSRVLTQHAPWPFEILVIDSGSTDGTLEVARAHDAVDVVCIRPDEFGHGRTRNLAISKTSGTYIALLTHDAEPMDDGWLARLVAAVEQDERIAGAFGRHIAYPDACAFTRRDLENHFNGFLAHPLVVDRNTDPEKYESDTGWRQFLHFFSDNNACLRRTVWEKHPYPDVDFAEDQSWADLVIRKGYAKAYAPDAVVYHSHDYGPVERFQRSFDEAMAFNKLFGYRPGKGFLSAMISSALLSVRDIRYFRRSENLSVPTVQLLNQILCNITHSFGQYAGTHNKIVPDFLIQKMSRDKTYHNRSASKDPSPGS